MNRNNEKKSYLIEMCDLNNDLIICQVKLLLWNLLDAIQLGRSIIDTFQLCVIFLYVEYLV